MSAFRGKADKLYGGSSATGQSTREKNGAENDRYDYKGIALSCDHEEHDRARGHKNCEFERASHGL
jgi:hypothetical protein